MNLRARLYKSVGKTLPQCKLLFSLKIDGAVILNSRTPFPYIFTTILFTNFSVVIAIVLTIAKLKMILKLVLVSINGPH